MCGASSSSFPIVMAGPLLPLIGCANSAHVLVRESMMSRVVKEGKESHTRKDRRPAVRKRARPLWPLLINVNGFFLSLSLSLFFLLFFFSRSRPPPLPPSCIRLMNSPVSLPSFLVILNFSRKRERETKHTKRPFDHGWWDTTHESKPYGLGSRRACPIKQVEKWDRPGTLYETGPRRRRRRRKERFTLKDL